MILLIDNYDSFTYNLAQYIGNFAEVKVLRNDDAGLYQAAEEADALVLSRSRLASRCRTDGRTYSRFCW